MSIKHRAYKRRTPPAPQSRAKTIPIMGKQPKLTAGELSRPEMHDRPATYSSEPTTLPDPRAKMNETSYDSTVPRRVVEAEIDELLAWAMPRFHHRWPRCTEQSVRPFLIMATRSGRYCFLRTSLCMALFESATDWTEPERVVRTIFVESQPSRGLRGTGVTGDGTVITDPGSAPGVYRGVKVELPNLYKAGFKWAVEIGAPEFFYDESTGADIGAVTDLLGTDGHRVTHSVNIAEALARAQAAADALKELAAE